MRVIEGGAHAGFLDPVGTWAAAHRRRRLDPTEQIAITTELLIAWLRLTVQDRSEAWDAVGGPVGAQRDGVTLEAHSPPPQP